MSFNPRIRRRFLCHALISATIFLIAGALLIVAGLSLSGWALVGEYARFCTECGERLEHGWCVKCERYSPRELLLAKSGILDTRLYNKHQDEHAKLISLVLTIALRDLASAVRLRNGVDEAQLWSLHTTDGWVEWISPPDSVFFPVAAAVMTIAGRNFEKATDCEAAFSIVDGHGAKYACRAKFTPAGRNSELLLLLERCEEALQPCDCS